MAGSNSEAQLRAAAETIKTLREQIAALQDEIKVEVAAAKSNGFNMKALNRVIKDMMLEPEAMEQQLVLELEIDTYRRAVGVRTEASGMHSPDNGKRLSASAPA